MNITEIALLAIAGAVVLLLLKSTGSVNAAVVRIAVVVLLILGVFPEIKELMSLLDTFNFAENIPKEALKIMLKVFSVLTISSIAGDVCRDNGESSLAGVVELCGKIISISLSIPVITSVISVAVSLFSST